MFNPKNLDNLTAEDYKSFLNFRNNKHWTGLERQGPEITQGMQKLKSTLKLLLDESGGSEIKIVLNIIKALEPLITIQFS